jgi:hypothetical protein
MAAGLYGIGRKSAGLFCHEYVPVMSWEQKKRHQLKITQILIHNFGMGQHITRPAPWNYWFCAKMLRCLWCNGGYSLPCQSTARRAAIPAHKLGKQRPIARSGAGGGRLCQQFRTAALVANRKSDLPSGKRSNNNRGWTNNA